jgi:hypothetical protein
VVPVTAQEGKWTDYVPMEWVWKQAEDTESQGSRELRSSLQASYPSVFHVTPTPFNLIATLTLNPKLPLRRPT